MQPGAKLVACAVLLLLFLYLTQAWRQRFSWLLVPFFARSLLLACFQLLLLLLPVLPRSLLLFACSLLLPCLQHAACF